MVFVIFGITSQNHHVSNYYRYCKHCKKKTSHQGMIVKRAFTLFFIPIIPLGSSKKIQCRNCAPYNTLSMEEYFENIAKSNSASIMLKTIPANSVGEIASPNVSYCPLCGNCAVWIEQYKKWYCNKCQRYI